MTKTIVCYPSPLKEVTCHSQDWPKPCEEDNETVLYECSPLHETRVWETVWRPDIQAPEQGVFQAPVLHQGYPQWLHHREALEGAGNTLEQIKFLPVEKLGTICGVTLPRLGNCWGSTSIARGGESEERGESIADWNSKNIKFLF